MDFVDQNKVRHVPRSVRAVLPKPEATMLCGEKLVAPFSKEEPDSDCSICAEMKADGRIR